MLFSKFFQAIAKLNKLRIICMLSDFSDKIYLNFLCCILYTFIVPGIWHLVLP